MAYLLSWSGVLPAVWTLLRTGTIRLGLGYYIWTVMTSKGFLGLGSVFFFLQFCVYGCFAYMHICAPLLCSRLWDQKRSLYPLEQEL